MCKKPVHQRGGSSAVDIVITEDRHLFPRFNGAHKPLGGLLAIGQHMRVGHQGANGGIKERQGIIHPHTAPGEHPGDQFRNTVDLGHGQRTVLPGLIQPRHPPLFCCRPLHA